MNRRLYRSPTDRVLAGVAGGMAETYELDPALVRIGWTLLILVSGGLFLVLYVVIALVVPLRPATDPLWSAASEAPPGGPPGGPPSSPPSSPPGAPPAAHGARSSGAGAAIVFGLLLILAGGFFFARQFLPALNLGLIWPVVAIAAGVLLIFAAFVSRERVR